METEKSHIDETLALAARLEQRLGKPLEIIGFGSSVVRAEYIRGGVSQSVGPMATAPEAQPETEALASPEQP